MLNKTADEILLICYSVKFSFDVRGKAISDAETWSDKSVFGPRAKFITQSDPAFLEIEVSQLVFISC